jgi:hypothetical protein
VRNADVDQEDQGTAPRPIAARVWHAAVAMDQRLLLIGGERKGALMLEPCITEAADAPVGPSGIFFVSVLCCCPMLAGALLLR